MINLILNVMKKVSKINVFKQKLLVKTPVFLGLFLLVMLLISSCESHNSTSDEVFNSLIIEEAQEIAEIDDTSESINEIIESSYLEIATSDFFKSSEYKSQQDRRFLSDCVLISKELKDGYLEIILDYGEGCTTKRQHEAKGKIIIHMDPSFETATVNMTYNFENFYINDKKIEGSVEKQRSRTNDNGNPQSQITKNIKILWEDGAYSTIEGLRTREWVDGKNNELWGDNVFSITGNWTITKKDGTVFTSTIIDPLIRTLACRFIISGIVEIKKAETMSQLDYGSGECDNLATMTKDGSSYEIHIRKKKG